MDEVWYCGCMFADDKNSEDKASSWYQYNDCEPLIEFFTRLGFRCHASRTPVKLRSGQRSGCNSE